FPYTTLFRSVWPTLLLPAPTSTQIVPTRDPGHFENRTNRFEQDGIPRATGSPAKWVGRSGPATAQIPTGSQHAKRLLPRDGLSSPELGRSNAGVPPWRFASRNARIDLPA